MTDFTFQTEHRGDTLTPAAKAALSKLAALVAEPNPYEGTLAEEEGIPTIYARIGEPCSVWSYLWREPHEFELDLCEIRTEQGTVVDLDTWAVEDKINGMREEATNLEAKADRLETAAARLATVVESDETELCLQIYEMRQEASNLKAKAKSLKDKAGQVELLLAA